MQPLGIEWKHLKLVLRKRIQSDIEGQNQGHKTKALTLSLLTKRQCVKSEIKQHKMWAVLTIKLSLSFEYL